jgi:predicted nucleotidyltransferase
MRKKLIRQTFEYQEHIDLYLFGSALFSINPSDIDLAVIYDKNYVSIQQAIQYRIKLIHKLSKILELNIDVLLLSKEEEKEAEFLSNAKHEIIKNHTHNK